MSLGSVRTRLTLWNTAILAAILGVFVVVTHYSVRLGLTLSVDHELYRRLAWEQEINGMIRGGLLPPGGAGNRNRRGSDRPGRPRNPEPGQPGPGSPRRFERPAPRRSGPPPGLPPASWPSDPHARLLNAALGPAIFDPRGVVLFPFAKPGPWDRDAFRQSMRGSTLVTTATVDGTPFRVISAPVPPHGPVTGVVQLARPLDESERLMQNVDRTLWLLLLPGLIVAGVSAAYLTTRSLRPVAQISDAAANMAAKDLSLRLPVTGNDEFSALSANFNRMMERLDAAFAVLRTTNANLEAAYERQRRFTADASHELRTPLTTIRANTSLALSGEPDLEVYHEALREADGAAGTMARIVDDLLFLARSDSDQLRLEPRTVPVRPILDAAVSEAERHRVGNPIEARGLDPDLRITGDPHHLRRLLLNLLENSIRHTPPDGSIAVTAEARDSHTILRVTDTGEGIAPEHLPRLFDRFYRVDGARSRQAGGAGLGLSICRSIAAAHGGTIEIDSRPGEGTTVTVVLPDGARDSSVEAVPGEAGATALR